MKLNSDIFIEKINQHKFILTFCAILFISLLLRLWGIWNGLPFSYYPDEAHFVKRAVAFGSGDLNPHWFHKPAFYMYLLFILYGVLYIIGRVLCFWYTVSDFAVLYIVNPGPFYLIGRITTTLFSTGAVFITYLLSKEVLKNKLGASISALIMAVSFGLVMTAKEVKADTPCMFFTIVSLLFLFFYIERDQIKWLLGAIIFAGIGTATKTYSVIMLIPIFFYLILRQVKNDRFRFINFSKRILGLAVLFYFVYFLCSPYSFLDPMGRKWTFGPYFSIIEKIQLLGNPGNAPDEAVRKVGDRFDKRISLNIFVKGFKSYINELAKGVGESVMWLSFMGFIWLLFRFNWNIFIFLLYPLLFAGVSIFIHPGYPEIRHQIVLYPFIASLAGYFIFSCHIFFKRKSPLLSASLTSILVLLSIIPSVCSVVEYNHLQSRPDTRNIAKKWIERNIPTGTKIIVDENSVQLLRCPENLRSLLQTVERSDDKGPFTSNYDAYLEYQIIAAERNKCYDLQETRLPWWTGAEIKEGVYTISSEMDVDMGNPIIPFGVETYDTYLERGFEYAVVSSDRYENFLKNSNTSKKYPSFSRFYRDLFNKGHLIKKFDNKTNQGPIIKIFRFN